MSNFLREVKKNVKKQVLLNYKDYNNDYLALKKYSLHKETLEDETKQEEGMLIILSGEGKVRVGENITRVNRKNVFEDKPEAVYVPISTNYQLSTEGNLEVILVTTPCKLKQDPFKVSKENIDVSYSGREEWKRKVRIIQGPKSKTYKLFIGETINLPGKWSGFPPHKHDTSNENESILRECYYYKISSQDNGFGLQHLYNKNNIDEIYKIDEEKICYLPEGYHPVVVTPGTKLYYLWVLAGPEKELKVTLDNDFAEYE